MLKLLNRTQDLLDATRKVDFLGPLALRLYLVPVFWIAGSNKLAGFDSVVQWFGNTEWGLGLPFPTLMAGLAIGTELIGAAFLLIGFATRWVTIPLLIQMLVAIFQVHGKNGWQAVHDKMSPFASDNVDGAMERLNMAKKLLREHGDYDWLTETGNFIVSNNGVEWAVTYGVMLLALFFIGGGRYVSADYWIHRKFRK
ncbi:MAG: DoxX family protein [Gammaproteobacteria bacterium]